MKIQKTKKGVVKIVELTPQDWQHLKQLAANAVIVATEPEEQMVACIVSELLLEKNNSPYVHLLPTNLKLKNYQVIALSEILCTSQNSYYQNIGVQLYGLFDQQTANNSIGSQQLLSPA